MHGIGASVFALGFLVTFLAAYVAHRLVRRGRLLLVTIIAFWPLLLTLGVERTQAFDRPPWWGFWAFVGLVIAAAALGAGLSARSLPRTPIR